MQKTLCDRCGAEIPANGKIWDFSWFSKFKQSGEYEPDGDPEEYQLCSGCQREIDGFLKQKQVLPAEEKRKKTKKQQIWELHQKGVKDGEIAEILCTTKNHVSTALHDLRIEKGIKLKSEEEKQKYVDEGKVLALRKAGWKIHDIAWDMGISESAVCEALNNHVTAG